MSLSDIRMNRYALLDGLSSQVDQVLERKNQNERFRQIIIATIATVASAVFMSLAILALMAASGAMLTATVLSLPVFVPLVIYITAGILTMACGVLAVGAAVRAHRAREVHISEQAQMALKLAKKACAVAKYKVEDRAPKQEIKTAAENALEVSKKALEKAMEWQAKGVTNHLESIFATNVMMKAKQLKKEIEEFAKI